MHGKIAQINISNGGVPKTSIPKGTVTFEGIEGDRQKNLKYHGGPDRAICLWSFEVIRTLQGEGHPIQPGDAGENITVGGLVWEELTVGDQFQIGEDVTLEITDFAPPCRTIAKYFKQRRYGRISHKKNPGTSRLYAKVLAPGMMQVGNRIHLIPTLSEEIS